MFSSTNPFGQSSSSPFGSPSVFGQTNNASNNPFAPKPFGSSTPFGSQTGGSLFGATSSGVFGAAQSSPFSSTTTFGASSSPAFGNTMPAFGASSTPAFGSSSSSFGGSSVFGQKPAFGGSGSSPTQTSPFESTNQQSQPAFGSSIFGASTPFGAISQPAFGASSTPAFGATSAPALFGTDVSSFSIGSSVFGQKPAFGGFGSSPTQTGPFGSTNQQSQPAFGSSIFGASTPFGATSQPAFGATSAPAFGSTNSPAFGATSTPGTPSFGATSTPPLVQQRFLHLGMQGRHLVCQTLLYLDLAEYLELQAALCLVHQVPLCLVIQPLEHLVHQALLHLVLQALLSSVPQVLLGASSTPSFSFGSSPAFGQSASAFGSSPFGIITPFAAQSSPFAGFGQSPFGSQRGGSRVAAFTPTTEADGGKLESISAMPVYKDKSHKELRWEDFGQSPFGSQRGGSRVAPFTPTTEADDGKLESISAVPVYKDKSHEELRWEDYQIGDKGGPLPAGQPVGGIGFSSSPANSNLLAPSPTFGQSAANPFSTSMTSNPFAPKTPSIGALNFGSSATPTISSSPFGASTSSGLFGSTSLSTSSTFGVGPSPSIFGSPFGSQRGGSRVAAFTPTEADDGKLESISAMPVYKDKSHEELRWEDYQIGDKGGPLPAGQPVGGIGFSSSPANSNLLAPPTFGQSAASPFSTSMTSNPFAPKTPSICALNFGSSATPTISSSPFGASTSSGLFGSTSSSTSSTFGVGPSPSIFGSSSLFSSSQATNGGFGSNTQSSPLFQSNAPSIGQTGFAFGQTTTSYGQNTSSPFGQGILGASTTPRFGVNTFLSTSSLISSSNALGFGQSNPSQPAQTTTGFGLSSFGSTQPAGGSPFGGMPGILGQSNIGQFAVGVGGVCKTPFKRSKVEVGSGRVR